jgi:hypothetical protein
MIRSLVFHVVIACCLCASMALGLVPAHAQTSAASDNPLAVLSLDRLSATREHPLFSPSRRAPQLVTASARPPPAPPPAQPPNIELHGTIINAEDAFAIIFSSAENRTTRVRVGDEIAGWKVSAIDERKMVLSLKERTSEYTIFDNKNASASAPGQGQQHNPTAPAPSRPRPRASLGRKNVQQQ